MLPTFSILTVLWSMCAAVCFMFAVVHMMLWLLGQRRQEYLLSAIAATAAGCNVVIEMLLVQTTDVALYASLLKIGNLVIFVVLMSLLWLMRMYLHAGSRALIALITLMWVITLIVNFVAPNSVVFSEITSLELVTGFWGESFVQAQGEIHPWKIVPDIASLLILLFMIHATWQAWHGKNRQRSVIVGGSSVLFILLAGVHTPLVDAGIVKTPYMIGFAFMAIIAALTWQLMADWRKDQDTLRQTEREMERLSRSVEMGEIGAGLAHELNQPLAAILSNAQAARRFLNEAEPEIGELREIVDDIIADDKRAGEIIHGLRNMMSRRSPETLTVDINEVVNFVTGLLAGELAAQDVMLIRQLQSGTSVAKADKVQTQQVVMNLVTNALRAVKSTQGARKITLRSIRQAGEVCVSVSDTGPGIPPGMQADLFEPFASSSEDGLGMGLAICKRIVERYEGRIWVEATSEAGTDVRFSLPTEEVT